MRSFRAACALLASLACFDSGGIVCASPAPQVAAAAAAPPSAAAVAALPASAQLLINQTVAAHQATGLQWDLLAAEALWKLVVNVETNGWPSPNCNWDNIYVRREW
jgi:hypothetical protein